MMQISNLDIALLTHFQEHIFPPWLGVEWTCGGFGPQCPQIVLLASHLEDLTHSFIQHFPVQFATHFTAAQIELLLLQVLKAKRGIQTWLGNGCHLLTMVSVASIVNFTVFLFFIG